MRSASQFRVVVLAAAALAALPGFAARAGDAPAAAPKVADGRKVSIEYTLKLDDGTQADSNVGQPPLVYEQGKGQILPALETALAGLSVNDTKHVKITPKDGYGDVDPNNVKQVALEEIPEAARQVDAMLIGVDAEGHQIPVRIKKIDGDKVTLDLNHPLAGHTLDFDVKIVKIE